MGNFYFLNCIIPVMSGLLKIRMISFIIEKRVKKWEQPHRCAEQWGGVAMSPVSAEVPSADEPLAQSGSPCTQGAMAGQGGDAGTRASSQQAV